MPRCGCGRWAAGPVTPVPGLGPGRSDELRGRSWFSRLAWQPAVGEKQQDVTVLEGSSGLVIPLGWLSPEQHALRQRERRGAAVANQDRRQVTRPSPAQGAVRRVVKAADRGGDDSIGEVAGCAVE